VRISVVMCTYNGARHLNEQLDSICRQTVAPYEVIIHDDRSTDNTPQILQQFASKTVLSVRIVSNSTRLGSTANFDRAIQECDGDVIVLADQDDIWKETKLQTLEFAFLADAELGYVFSDGDVIDEQGRQVGCSMWESLGYAPSSLLDRFKQNETLFLLKHNVVTGAAMAFRSSLIPIVHPIPPEWIHDHWIALLGSIFTCGRPLADRLIMYRQHPGQQKGVRQRSIAEKYRESLAAETESARKIERLKELEERISRLSATQAINMDNIGAVIQEKINHIAKRSAARSAKGVSRIKVVLSEMVAGRYHRFSDSWISAARDLIA